MPEPEIEVKEGEPQVDPQEKVDVTPPAKISEEDQLAAKIKSDFEALYGSRLKQTEDRLHGAQRIIERQQRELEEAKRKPPVPAAPIPAASDPWAKIEDGSVWKGEIEKVAQQKAEAIIQAKEAERQAAEQAADKLATLEYAKARAIGRYPDLHPETGDPSSLVSKTYAAVLAENPKWLTDPLGPIAAMDAMEERLKAQANQNGQPKSVTPASRLGVAQGSLTPSRSLPATPGKITLTREQKAFCDRHNLDYATYAKNLSMAETGAVES